MEYNDVTYRNKQNWNIINTTTIIDWISSSNLSILLLDNYLTELRSILQVNTLWSLLISSVTSAVSVTQFTITDTEDPLLSLAFKIVIAFTSVMTSLITGYIKVEKIQETIENIEEHKQKWLKFMNSLTTELQVGCEFRNDANLLINSKKDEFNSINSKQIEIPERIRQKVSLFLLQKKRVKDIIRRQESICYYLPSCQHIWSCCTWSEVDYNIEKLNIQLSFFNSINRNMEKELLDLMFCYPKQIVSIDFNKESDLFEYKIKNASLEREVNKKSGASSVKLSNAFIRQSNISHSLPSIGSGAQTRSPVSFPENEPSLPSSTFIDSQLKQFPISRQQIKMSMNGAAAAVLPQNKRDLTGSSSVAGVDGREESLKDHSVDVEQIPETSIKDEEG